MGKTRKKEKINKRKSHSKFPPPSKLSYNTKMYSDGKEGFTTVADMNNHIHKFFNPATEIPSRISKSIKDNVIHDIEADGLMSHLLYNKHHTVYVRDRAIRIPPFTFSL